MKRAVLVSIVLLSIPAAVTAATITVAANNALARTCYLSARAIPTASTPIEACDRALAEEPLTDADRTATFVNRGVILMKGRQDYGAATADFDRALAVTPEQPTALINKATAILGSGGSAPTAIALLDQALASKPTEPWVGFYMRGYAHEEAGNLRAAYVDYRQAASLKPDFALATEALSRFTVRPARS